MPVSKSYTWKKRLGMKRLGMKQILLGPCIAFQYQALENTMITHAFTDLVQLPETQFEHSIPCDRHKTNAFSLMLN